MKSVNIKGMSCQHCVMAVTKARAAELREMKIKLVCGAILSVIIFFGSMQHWFSFLEFIPGTS